MGGGDTSRLRPQHRQPAAGQLDLVAPAEETELRTGFRQRLQEGQQFRINDGDVRIRGECRVHVQIG